MRRRRLLQVAGLGALTGLATSPWHPDASRQAARAIGRRYLQTRPGADQLLSVLGAVNAAVGSAHPLGDPRLPVAVAGDFRHGRTVEVDGWILTCTELGACTREALR